MSRRRLLGGLVATGVTLATWPGSAALAAPLAPPLGRPGPDTPPGAALARLLAGNQRYRRHSGSRRNFGAMRAQRAAGQAPFAAVFACADSRAAPELIFDQGLGDIFSVRNAGLAADEQAIGSLEYAVAVLGTPLILAVGHSSCGAVEAAMAAVQTGKRYPGHIDSIVALLAPSVRNALAQAPMGQTAQQMLQLAVEASAVHSAQALLAGSAILGKAQREQRLAVVPAYYEIATGRVRQLI